MAAWVAAVYSGLFVPLLPAYHDICFVLSILCMACLILHNVRVLGNNLPDPPQKIISATGQEWAWSEQWSMQL